MENARFAASLAEAEGLRAEKSKVNLYHWTGCKGSYLIGRRRRLGLESPHLERPHSHQDQHLQHRGQDSDAGPRS